jgi:hypothetical protein
MPKSQTAVKKAASAKVAKNSKKIIKSNDKPSAKPKKALEVKWNPKNIKDGDIFSCNQYMKITGVWEEAVFLQNDRGESVGIRKHLLQRDSWSADHFEKEVTCTMTELSEIIKGAQDTIFKVNFLKSLDSKNIIKKLEGKTVKDFQGDATSKKIANEILEGETCELIAHLVKSEQNLGRSLVLDCRMKAPFNFR